MHMLIVNVNIVNVPMFNVLHHGLTTSDLLKAIRIQF